MDPELTEAAKKMGFTEEEWEACTKGNNDIDKTELARILKLQKKFERMLQVPVVGFNSGRYDMNLIRDHLFEVLAEDANSKNKAVINVIKAGNGYMCLSTPDLKFMDISNYCAADTGSLDKYMGAYLGKCSCEKKEKITCLCPMAKKEHFPYDYLTSYEMLDQPGIPPRWAFDNHKKGTKISDAEYARVKFLWKHYNMKTLRDYLRFYNNSDVVPFAKAVKEQQKFFRGKGLDMFHDGVSLPGLAENLMYKDMFESLKLQPKIPGTPFDFPQDRFRGYKAQDAEAERTHSMTLVHVNMLLWKQQHICALCYCQLTPENASVDRLDNSKGHTNDNIQLTCINCNKARGTQSIKSFKYKKLLEYNGDSLVWSIDEEYKHIYQMMRDNITGGPAIIFNRYAKRGVTYIRNGNKLVANIIGLDCIALYPYAFGEREMPCGRLTTIELYDTILDDILADKLFGFLECDISTPEHLREKFEEFPPIFKNIDIDPTDKSVIGEHMWEFNQKRDSPAKKARKLISSYFGTKILIYTPLLKWYIEHGLVVTKMYSFVKASSGHPFAKFVKEMTDARRLGDKSKEVKPFGDSCKTTVCSGYGRCGMDYKKHKNVKYAGEEMLYKMRENQCFIGDEELQGDMFEVTMRKRRVKLANPIHVFVAIQQLTKLRMLEFYHDCIDRYIDRSDFQYQSMDTDSAYIAFSADNPFPDLVKPHLREEWEANKHLWFPCEGYGDKRTPGLFRGVVGWMHGRSCS